MIQMKKWLMVGVLAVSSVMGNHESWGVYEKYKTQRGEVEEQKIVAAHLTSWKDNNSTALTSASTTALFVLSHLLSKDTWNAETYPQKAVKDLNALAERDSGDRAGYHIQSKTLNALSKFPQKNFYLVSAKPTEDTNDLFCGSSATTFKDSFKRLNNALDGKDHLQALTQTVLLLDYLKLESTGTSQKITFQMGNATTPTFDMPKLNHIFKVLGILKSHISLATLKEDILRKLATQCTDATNPNHVAGAIVWADHVTQDPAEAHHWKFFSFWNPEMETDLGKKVNGLKGLLQFWSRLDTPTQIEGKVPPVIFQTQARHIVESPDTIENLISFNSSIHADQKENTKTKLWQKFVSLASGKAAPTPGDATDSIWLFHHANALPIDELKQKLNPLYTPIPADVLPEVQVNDTQNMT